MMLLVVFSSGCIKWFGWFGEKEKGDEGWYPFIDEGMENITFTDVAWKPDGAYALLVGYYSTTLSNATVVAFDGNTFTYILTNITMKYDGESFRLTRRMGLLESVCWAPDGSYALIVGRGGVVLRYDGTTLSGISGISYDYDLCDISWDPKYNCFTILGNHVSYPYAGALWEYDGSKITTVANNIGTRLTGIAWKNDGSYALISSMGYGTLWKYENNKFTLLSYGENKCMYDVAWEPAGGYALVVGDNIVVKYDGNQFTIFQRDDLKISIDCMKVDWKSDGNSATIIGDFGRILEWNGTNFINYSAGINNQLQGIDWDATGDYALIVGYNTTGYPWRSVVLSYRSNGVIEYIPIERTM